jgi:hypothetical protein
MEIFKLWIRAILIGFTVLFLSITSASAAAINFSGPLDVIDLDTGSGVYSGTPIGTNFSGFIDDVSANGEITDGTTITLFSCCLAAGGLSVDNDIILDAADASFLNTVLGSPLFSSGDMVDIINIEGDAATAAGGDARIEIGLSYIFAGNTFIDDALSNYPFNPNDVLLDLFFIAEEDFFGDDIYSAVGQLDSPPPDKQISDLANLIMEINLNAGISNSLDGKLDTALGALDDTNTKNDGAALNSMYAFCSSLSAQRGKKLSDDQAGQLIAAANGIIASLDEFAPLCE